MPEILLSHLQELAAQDGLQVVGWTSPETLSEDQERLRRWQGEGRAGEMQFMNRDPHLLASPQMVYPETRSVAVFAVTYDQGRVERCPAGHGRVARYAWGRDYHKVIRKMLQRLVARVQDNLGASIVARTFSDSVPLMERALAHRGGLGFIGKNTMLITPGTGSFLFLAELLWNVTIRTPLLSIVMDSNSGPVATPPSPLDRAKPAAVGSCGDCSRCLTGCPTGALDGPRSLDARRCISYLTIEKRGALTVQERHWLGEWVFGCDICQEVCPFNYTAMKEGRRSEIKELMASSGVGATLALGELLRIENDAAFVARFGGTALMRTKREGLVRNAAVVAANTCAVDLHRDLIQRATSDVSGIVRSHSLWALGSLAVQEGSSAVQRVVQLAEHLSSDPDEMVRCEAMAIIEGAEACGNN